MKLTFLTIVVATSLLSLSAQAAINGPLSGANGAPQSTTYNNNFGHAYIDAKNAGLGTPTSPQNPSQQTPATKTVSAPAVLGTPQPSTVGKIVGAATIPTQQTTLSITNAPAVLGTSQPSTIGKIVGNSTNPAPTTTTTVPNDQVTPVAPATTQTVQVGVPTPVSQVPAVTTNIPKPVVSVPVKIARGGHNEHTGKSRNDRGTGNGANNAANSNSAHGLGSGSNIGGGRAGGGFHY